MGNEDSFIEERKRQLRETLGINTIPEDVDLFSFRPGGRRRHYAVVNSSNTWDVIANGYRLAAEELAVLMLSSGNNQDELVYPICFLYRSYLETRLKELLVSAKPAIDVIKYKHDLLKLWQDAEPLVRQYSGGPIENLDRIKRCIGQFHEIHRAGDGFRYPVSAKGAKNLASLTQIDIGTLRRTMETIAGEPVGPARASTSQKGMAKKWG